MSENGNDKLETSAPEPTTPATTNKETGNTCIVNRKGNFRRGNKGGSRWSDQKDFMGETPKLKYVLGLITERLDQGVTFDKFQDILKNHVLKNLRKAEDMVEISTDLNNLVINFDTKHIPDDLTKKLQGS